MNDQVFRAAGFVIGILLLACLWLNARTFKSHYPLLSLALLGLNPSVIRWGDSLRGYGLGMTLAGLTCALIWRFLENSTPKRLIAAICSATISVHVLYYNAPVVMAFCISGGMIAFLSRDWRKAVGIALVGTVSGASLIIYLPVIRNASSWNSLVRIPQYTAGWFQEKLAETLLPLGAWAISAWIFCGLLSLWAPARAFVLDKPFLSEREKRKEIFLVFALLLNAAFQFLFLKGLSYVTQPWYYLILLTTVAICVDAILGTLLVDRTGRVLRISAALLIGGFSASRSVPYLEKRMTNIDSAANVVASAANHSDLILVDPWYFGVSFNRYYNGMAPWITVPPIHFREFHRFDLFIPAMKQADQAAPANEVIAEIRNTLKRGNSLYVISETSLWNLLPRPLLPPARIPADGWRAPLYQTQWTTLVGNALSRHALRRDLQQSASTSTGIYENVRVTRFSGWRD